MNIFNSLRSLLIVFFTYSHSFYTHTVYSPLCTLSVLFSITTGLADFSCQHQIANTVLDCGDLITWTFSPSSDVNITVTASMTRVRSFQSAPSTLRIKLRWRITNHSSWPLHLYITLIPFSNWQQIRSKKHTSPFFSTNNRTLSSTYPRSLNTWFPHTWTPMNPSKICPWTTYKYEKKKLSQQTASTRLNTL